MAGSITLTTLLLLVALALAFDFLNGFHDAANSIATVVSTGVLRPYQAVIWAAFFNFLAVAIFELKVAATVGKGIVVPEFVDARLIFGALIGAISWNIITWYYGIPSSSSHALIGGMIGAAIAKAGTHTLILPGIAKIALVHRDLAGARSNAGRADHGDRVVDFLSLLREAGRPVVPATATHLIGALQPRTWQQRRTEDHGGYLAAADLGRHNH